MYRHTESGDGKRLLQKVKGFEMVEVEGVDKRGVSKTM